MSPHLGQNIGESLLSMDSCKCLAHFFSSSFDLLDFRWSCLLQPDLLIAALDLHLLGSSAFHQLFSRVDE